MLGHREVGCAAGRHGSSFSGQSGGSLVPQPGRDWGPQNLIQGFRSVYLHLASESHSYPL